MSDLLFQATSFLFFIFIISNTLFWLRLWEDKEYNWKRLFIHLFETTQGRTLLIGWESLTKWLIIFVYAVTIFSTDFDIYFHFIIFALYLYLFIKIVYKIYNKDFFIPVFSLNSSLIMAFSLIVQAILFTLPPLDRFLWILVLDRSLPVIISSFVLMYSVFFDFNTDILENKAFEKLSKHKNLLSIAVVGSYGKGTTKEFIARVLSSKFNVLETKKSFNTNLGIAKTILSGLTPKKQIFIAEMEDNTKGEIGEMSNMIIPKIAVVTGINDRKISIFGSLQKILESKFQVIDALPRSGIALFNANNKNSIELFKRTKKKKFLYGTEVSKIKSLDIKAFNIKVSKFSVSFEIKVFGKDYKISGVKLLGKQSVENLLPAIFIGLYMGMNFLTIKKVLEEIRPLPKSMEPRLNSTGVILINDTYNLNVNSVRRALDYMKIYKGKKILILEPLLELGKNAKKDHFSLGKEIGSVCDYLFLTNNNYSDFLKKGIVNSNSKCKVSISNPARISEFIEKNCKKEDVAVFEGEQAYNSFSALTSESAY